MTEYIYELTTDADGIDCYIKRGELIRCKNCVHYKTDIDCTSGKYNGCDVWLNDGNEIPCEENDFCSRAERREDE